MKTTDFANPLAEYLTYYLPVQRNVSPNTVKAYRDTFVLFLRYCRDKRGWSPEKMPLKKLDAPVILEFLEFLKKERKCRSNTRNHRLAALRSFFRYVQAEIPEYLMQCQRILSIRAHRCERREIRYLAPDEVQMLLAQPDQNTLSGRRDTALLTLLYDSGARVQELLDLHSGDVRLGTAAHVRLTGKGRKIRIVPLLSATVELLTPYMNERDLLASHNSNKPLFVNRHGKRISRFGVRYILDKYMKRMRSIHSGLNFPVSPHTLRHSKAMHLLEANIPLVVIRDILGHVDINTTEIYARASLKMKREALERIEGTLPKPPKAASTWRKDKGLLEWLESL